MRAFIIVLKLLLRCTNCTHPTILFITLLCIYYIGYHTILSLIYLDIFYLMKLIKKK